LLRFVEPQPQRSIGLAWRQTSPRKAEFFALGRMVVETLKVDRPQKRPCGVSAMSSRSS
jgi:LysR family transcriptional regulator, hydrogen peroxide-inducible genes activator